MLCLVPKKIKCKSKENREEKYKENKNRVKLDILFFLVTSNSFVLTNQYNL